MRIKIFLIDDDIKLANNLIEQLNAIAQRKNNEAIQFEFAFLRGTSEEEYHGETHLFYDESVLEKIEETRTNTIQNGEQIGLLLDILLTKEDMDSSYASYYPEAHIAKKVYNQFCKRMPIYLISSFPGFATQCDVIMGEELADKFITHNAILQYKIQDDIDKLFQFYAQIRGKRKVI